MSKYITMKVARYVGENKNPEILCDVKDYNKISCIVDDLSDTYNYPNSLENNTKKECMDYKVYTIEAITEYIKKKKCDIEACKEKIKELKDYLKAYYQGGHHNVDIEDGLREEIYTYEECVNPNNHEENDICCLNAAESFLSDIDFITEYLKPLKDEDDENKVFIVLITEW